MLVGGTRHLNSKNSIAGNPGQWPCGSRNFAADYKKREADFRVIFARKNKRLGGRAIPGQISTPLMRRNPDSAPQKSIIFKKTH
jgi:hypothetical protein